MLNLRRGDPGWLERQKGPLAKARHTFAAVERGTKGQHVMHFSTRDLLERRSSPLPVVRYLGAAARPLREVGAMPGDFDHVRQQLHKAVRRAEWRCAWWLLLACWRCV